MKHFILLSFMFLASACYTSVGGGDGRDDGDPDATDTDAADTVEADADAPDIPVPCGPGEDSDGDTIRDDQEGSGDLDGDTVPNAGDMDSDNDTLPDSLEAGDGNCETPPLDSDEDGDPDFLDTDSDDNGVSDYVEGSNDTDGDGISDYRDRDNDNDGIPDEREVGPDPESPLDTDGDGIADYMDMDSDSDNILDRFERDVDVDADGVPNFRDSDSDDDGIPDSVELDGCGGDSVNPVDTDGDGAPDFIDRDSDNDGLPDAVENEISSNPCRTDTDSDGFDDLAEWAHPTADPTDPDEVIPEDDYYIVLAPGDSEERDLDFTTDLTMADVFLLVDTTGSMYSEIDRIQATLSSMIMPEIRARVPHAWFGVGWFADFATAGYGYGSDLAFALLQTMTDDFSAVQSAVNILPENNGADWPESQVEALYQTATGEGLGPWVPEYSCDGGFGAACFRPGALPIILLFTDAPFHNGPPYSPADDYVGITPTPHTWTQAIDALSAINAKVVGLNSEGTYTTDAQHDLVATAEATGSVDLEGSPLVYDIGSSGEYLDIRVVDAVETLASDVPVDVDTYVRDMPDPYTDPGWVEVDASCFVKERVPQPGWTPPPGYTAEEAVERYDLSTFYTVVPGTRVTFRVTFENSLDGGACYEGDDVPRVFLARIVVRGDRSTDLDERIVVILVPAR
jgi:hypothetical protein